MQAAVSGTILYKEYSEVVESLVRTEAKTFLFPGLDYDDIAQEIRVECIRVMSKFDSARIGPSPYKYLKQCIKNFLYNKRRGIYVPNNPPCVRCPYWSKSKKTCLIDEMGCQKIIDYRNNMAKKAAIFNPAALESEILDGENGDELDALALNESIKEILPSNLLQSYKDMLEGKEVPSSHKKEIRIIVKEIIDNA